MPVLTAGQKPLFATASDTLTLLANTNFNPRTEVYLPMDVRTAVTVSNSATVKILSLDYSPQKIHALVDAGAHDITLVYVDWNFRIGLLLSVMTLAIAVVFYWISGIQLKVQSSKFRMWP